MMVAFIDAHKGEFGIEAICRELPIAPSTYHAARARPPSARAVLMPLLLTLWVANYRVYGPASCGRPHAGPVRTSAGTRSPV